MTVRCRHCGPVDVTDPEVARANADVLDALAQGHAPLAAMTCPLCRDEVRAKDVTR